MMDCTVGDDPSRMRMIAQRWSGQRNTGGRWSSGPKTARWS